MLELRAARSLGALLASTGAVDQAGAALGPVLAGFEEGHETMDVVEARGLMEAL